MRGIDVSNHQGSIDWARVRSAGVGFAIVKATEGRSFTDAGFAGNRRAAKAAGVRVGAYHYARPDHNSPAEEVAHFLSVARPVAGELLPALDFEHPTSLGAAELRAWAARWLELVADEIGARPLFYSFPSYITDRMGGAAGLGGYPLWLASWGSNDGRVHPVRLVGPWKALAVHQFTSNGAVAGVAGRCDVNELRAANLDAITYKPAARRRRRRWRVVYRNRAGERVARIVRRPARWAARHALAFRRGAVIFRRKRRG